MSTRVRERRCTLAKVSRASGNFSIKVFGLLFSLLVEVCRKCFHKASENDQSTNMHTHNNETNNEQPAPFHCPFNAIF